MSPTIYDVANAAGVSISTVSLALNRPDRVRQPTLGKIMKAVDTLGYIPRADAVARARLGVRRVGVIAPFTDYPSFAVRLNGVIKAAADENFEIIVYNEGSAATSRLASLPVTRPVDGILLLSLPMSDEIAERVQEQKLTTVLVDVAHPGFSSVTVDDEAGGRLVGELVRKHGHHHTAFLGHAQSMDYESSSRLRARGFAGALDHAPVLVGADYSIESAEVAASKLFTSDPRPTAVFAYDDVMAAGVLRAARVLGLRVPEDVEVIGYDDTSLATGLGLTSVRQPLEESGRIGTQLLLDLMTVPRTPLQQVVLSVELVERDTTRP